MVADAGRRRPPSCASEFVHVSRAPGPLRLAGCHPLATAIPHAVSRPGRVTRVYARPPVAVLLRPAPRIEDVLSDLLGNALGNGAVLEGLHAVDAPALGQAAQGGFGIVEDPAQPKGRTGPPRWGFDGVPTD